MQVQRAIVSGVFGAVVVTLLDRGWRRLDGDATRAARRRGAPRAKEHRLGGFVASALYLSPMAYARRAWLPRAVIHGVFAGLVVGHRNPGGRTVSIALHTLGAVSTIALGRASTPS